MSLGKIIAYATVLLFFITSLYVSLFTDSQDYAVSALMSYFGMVLYVIIIYDFLENKVINVKDVIKSLIYGIFFFMLFKLIVFFLPILGVDAFILMELISDYVPGAAKQLFPIGGGKFFLRLTLGNDTLICYAFLILLFAREKKMVNFSRGFVLLYSIISIVNIFLSTTRSFLIELVFGICLFFVLFKKKGLIYVSLFLIFLAVSVSWVFTNVEEVKTYYEIRMNDMESIRVKQEQNYYLMKEWDKYQLLGKGLGSYSPALIRSSYQPYQYEVQWTSLLLQFGLIKMLLFFGFLFYCSIKMKIVSKFSLNKSQIYIGFLFLFFLATAFTNPYLFIFNAGINYIMFLYFVFLWRLDENSDIRY